MLTEVDAADQLAHDDEIHALRGDIRAQRAGARKLLEHVRRADVAVEVHCAAQLQQALFGTVFRRLRVPLRAADRAEQHTVAGKADLARALRQRHAELVDGAAAHGRLGIAEAVAEFLGRRVEHGDGLLHNLRADAVSPDHGDGLFHVSAPPFRAGRPSGRRCGSCP